MDARRIGVVMLACGEPRYAERCLGSLLAEAGAPLEAVLVDNGSGPEVGEVFDRFEGDARAAAHTVRRLRFETNVGAVRGRNEALALVESDYVSWLDSDCLARTRGWLAKLARFLDEHRDVGIVGPRLVYPWPPHDIQCAGCDVTRSGRVVFRGRGRPRDDPRFGQQRDCPTLISACWLMRTRLFGELGPLDERFSPVQFEDVDYCYRARQAGSRVVYLPRVDMYHFEGITTAHLSGKMGPSPFGRRPPKGSGVDRRIDAARLADFGELRLRRAQSSRRAAPAPAQKGTAPLFHTPGIGYNITIARHAVKFKRKWRGVIEREGGIDDADAPRWQKDVGWRPIEEVGELEVVD